MSETLPLFPLHTVLVPGATLGLRVFETRYLDLVRDCGRHGTGFGVCLILEGAEVGAPATHVAFGTEARIVDFGSTKDGLLTLRLRGARRFHVKQTQVRDNGLIVADVEWCEHDTDDELRSEHALLGTVLERIFEQIGGEYLKLSPSKFDDAAWVGWRLTELLPLSPTQRQAILQENDAHVRLDMLLALMP